MRARMATMATMVACALLLGGFSASAGQWKYGYNAAANLFDFDVGNGTLYWVNYAAGSPAYYDGTIACAAGPWSSLTVSRSYACNFDNSLSFPHGHAERVAVGQPAFSHSYPIFVATAEGHLWTFYAVSPLQRVGSWQDLGSLPSGLPTGVGSYGVLRLIYEQINNATGQAPANPVWLLGSDHHIYRLTGSGGVGNFGTTWVDVSNANSLGAVAQLSFSRMYNSVVCTWGDGTSAYFDEGSNLWYYVTGAATVGLTTFGVQTESGYSFLSPAFASGGLFQAWNSEPLTAASNFTTAFMIGTWGAWYDISTNPSIPGYPAITGASHIDIGASGAWYDTLNYSFSAANAGIPDEEVPISIVEGSYLSASSYTGGPSDTGYGDLFWVLTNHLRMYFYEE